VAPVLLDVDGGAQRLDMLDGANGRPVRLIV
jgi:hypothetical protein